MNKDQITISPSEWEVMEPLWEQSPLSAAEIFEALGSQTNWNTKTVRAFLDRLEKKQAVRKDKAHGINVYVPLRKRENCLRQETRSFLDRFFRGNPVSVISHFIEGENLTSDDIERLQKLLEDKKSK